MAGAMPRLPPGGMRIGQVGREREGERGRERERARERKLQVTASSVSVCVGETVWSSQAGIRSKEREFFIENLLV